jgi:plasmid stability protein
MPTLTVRNLDDDTKAALAALAASHGRSMEAEARVILAEAVRKRVVADAGGLGTRIRDRFAGLDWEAPTERSPERPRGAQLT